MSDEKSSSSTSNSSSEQKAEKKEAEGQKESQKDVQAKDSKEKSEEKEKEETSSKKEDTKAQDNKEKSDEKGDQKDEKKDDHAKEKKEHKEGKQRSEKQGKKPRHAEWPKTGDFSGWLNKHNHGFVSKIQKRYFVLKNEALYYYHDSEGRRPGRHELPLTDAVVIDKSTKKHFGFMLKLKKDVHPSNWYFIAESYDSLQAWLKALQKWVQKSPKKTEKKSDTEEKKDTSKEEKKSSEAERKDSASSSSAEKQDDKKEESKKDESKKEESKKDQSKEESKKDESKKEESKKDQSKEESKKDESEKEDSKETSSKDNPKGDSNPKSEAPKESEANASNTKVEGAGLKSGTVAEVSAFTIQCVKGGVGDKLKAELVPEADPNAKVPVKIEDKGGGLYEAKFTPQRAGPHVLHVMFADRHVVGSPFAVTISSLPPSAKHSKLSGDLNSWKEKVVSTFQVTAHDKTGAKVTQGGAQLKFELKKAKKEAKKEESSSSSSSSDKEYASFHVADNNNGTYTVTVTPSKDGHFLLHVWMNGEEIEGSPFTVNIAKESKSQPSKEQPKAEAPKEETKSEAPKEETKGEELNPFPRLLRVSGKGQNITISLVPLSNTSLNSSEVFILDTYDKLIQWIGSGSGIFLRNKASQICRVIDDERASKAEISVHNEGDRDLGLFWRILGGEITPSKENPTPGDLPHLLKISDESGKMTFTSVAKGVNVFKKSMLNSNDTFIFDTGFEIFVWEGKKSNKDEKKFAAQAARSYVQQYKRPANIKITRCMEGGENKVFNSFFT
jgi:hypothetical protein